MGVKLWNPISKGDKVFADMLPSWRVVFEVLKAQEKSHANNKGDTPCPPSTAKAQSSLKHDEMGDLMEESAYLSVQPTAPPLTSKREG